MNNFEIYKSWFPWDRISDKPDNFNPSPHLHDIDDINNLNSAINQINADIAAIPQYWNYNAIHGLAPVSSDKRIYDINHICFERLLGAKINYYGPTSVFSSGIQNYTLYFRSEGDFAWYRRGAYDPTRNNPGGNGYLQMVLKNTGSLGINGIQPETTLDVNGGTQTSFIQFKDRTQPIKQHNIRKYTGGFYSDNYNNTDNKLLRINLPSGDRLGKLTGKIFAFSHASCQEYNIILQYRKQGGHVSVLFNTFYNATTFDPSVAILRCYRSNSSTGTEIFLTHHYDDSSYQGMGWDLFSIEPESGVSISFFEDWSTIDVSAYTLVNESPIYIRRPTTTIN